MWSLALYERRKRICGYLPFLNGGKGYVVTRPSSTEEKVDSGIRYLDIGCRAGWLTFDSDRLDD
jgi:hypothetical protein